MSAAIDTLIKVSIEDEMRSSYLDYAMSVIISRALPDARDGLKPVHRRILFSMHEMNNYYEKPYKKSARVVGDVIGKYHPHGNDAIYGSLVRMAQPFSLRDMLVDGQGNFGSVDGDAPAQMRYTEVRLAKISEHLLADIEMDTVNFQDNYDGSEQEPSVLPAGFPNLLVNGASGIAVGMATSIASHNLGEVIDACFLYIANPEVTAEELIQVIPGPDFPTGGIITNPAKAKQTLLTGRGSITIRSKTHFEEIGGKDSIVITEIPYQVNKAEMLKKIETLIKAKTIEGISEIRDESNKLGIRAVIELKKGTNKEVMLNQLFKFTPMQGSFAANMLAIDNGEPKLLNILDLIRIFIRFREEIVQRRCTFLLNKARIKAHLLLGMHIAVSNIDQVIKLIKSSPDPQAAKEALMSIEWDAKDIEPLLKLVDDHRNVIKNGKCNITEEQAKAILDMKLQRLTALEKNKINEELNELAQEISYYIKILSSREEILNVIKEELQKIKQKFSTPRLTLIENIESDVDDEDLIQREDMIVTMTYSGYIKRVPLATYRTQRRGGKGRSGVTTQDDNDFTTALISTNTHDNLLFFSDKGMVYRLKVYKLPLGTPTTKGRALINLLPLDQDEKINTIIAVDTSKKNEEIENSKSIIFVTQKGNIRRNSLSDFENIHSNGKIAIRLDEGDKLIGVRVCTPEDHVFIATLHGKAIRFDIKDLRIFKSRVSDGVRGIKLLGKDRVISMTTLYGAEIDLEKREEYLRISLEDRLDIKEKGLVNILMDTKLSNKEIIELAQNEEFILTITEKGYGKRTSAYEYRTSGRAGQGILNIDTGSRNGNVVSSFVVEANDSIMVATDGGTLLRTSVNNIRVSSRNTMGVKIIDLKEGEKVVSMAKVEIGEDEEVENVAANNNE